MTVIDEAEFLRLLSGAAEVSGTATKEQKLFKKYNRKTNDCIIKIMQSFGVYEAKIFICPDKRL